MDIEWNDSLKIGDPEIDEQHEQWFAAINKFLRAPDKESLVLFEVEMYRYTRVHFSHEEELMRSIGYPDISAHVKQHNILLAKLNEIAYRIQDNSLDLQVMKDFLSNWLTGHIASSDTKLVSYVNAI